MPDIFSGSPAPHDIYFDSDEFLANHTTEVTDPIIDTTIRYIRDQLLFDRIAVTGYCFGGRYAFRFLAEGRGADIAFAAHPSFLQDNEVSAISGPASIAAAGKYREFRLRIQLFRMVFPFLPSSVSCTYLRVPPAQRLTLCSSLPADSRWKVC